MNFKTFSIITLFSVLTLSCGGDNVTETLENPSNPSNPMNNYTDAELIEKVQKGTLSYFWDYAETNSKLARERYHTDNPGYDATVISTGGSGFGLMTILVGIKNNYITRSEAVSRMTTALNFLENADRFHGAWPHWINGTNGNVIPFSGNDDGADLVETAFLAQGLICVREYFKNSTDASELELSQKADALWQGIEWSWFSQNPVDTNVLYWHWSPNVDWAMDHKIQGFDETLITYVLAAASPTHTIPKAVYTIGWQRNGAIASSSAMYGIPTVVAHNGASGGVGPMFFSHYSFLGLDPRGLSDDFVNYQTATTNHAQINFQYCATNPKNWTGYSTKNWGLTASYTRNSDGSTGYHAHKPSAADDLGIISPTAALSSMPYTPNQTMNYLRFLYNENESNYIGVAGPYDAYSVHYNWKTPRYLAIDQGPIAPMIENHQSQFLWNLFMNAPDVRLGLIKLGFHSTIHGF